MKPHVIEKPFGWLRNLRTPPKLAILSTLILLSLTIISSINNSNISFLQPYQHASPSSSSSSPAVSNSAVKKPEQKECDVSRGEWIRDLDAPYYTNVTCWMIQEHQNCMKYGRPDGDFLNWRWRPDSCELVRFDPVRFLEVVKGKSMAFVGDSLARNQMQSLMCLLSKVKHPQDISNNSDENFKRMFYPSHNFTISIFWSPFLVKSQEPTEPSSSLWNLYLDEADDAWSTKIDEFDYLIVSGGNWFTRPSMFYEKEELVGCHYCLLPNVTDLTLRYSHRMAFRTAFRAINESAKFKGVVLLRTLSPDHFEDGEWDHGGNCVRTKPFRRDEVRLEGTDLELYRAQLEELENARAEGREEGGIEFRLLDTTEAMLTRPDGHPSRYGHWAYENVTLYNDCVHWCLPGPVDVWNDFLLHMLSLSAEEHNVV